MRPCFFALLFIACSAVEAQRVYYQAGFPPAPGRHLFLANRQRTRFANGFSARLQQTTDKTDEQDITTGINSAGGVGIVNSIDDSEMSDNNIDDSELSNGEKRSNLAPGSTKTQTPSSINGVGSDDEDNSSETADDGSSNDNATIDTTSGGGNVPDTSSEDIDDTSTSSRSGESEKGGNKHRPSSNGNVKHSGESSNDHEDDGSYDHGDHGDTIDWLKDAIQGEPGKDYPIFSEIPQTGFKCSDQKYPGYYGDVEAKCQVFHICQADGRMDSFLCPNGTIFAQNYFVCVWWHDFSCSTTESFYNLNENLYKPGKAIDGSDVLISPLDMMNDLMPMILGGTTSDSDSSREMSGNTIDENSNNAIDESNEGEKINFKTNTNDNGIIDSSNVMSNINPSSNSKSNNGLKSKTNLFKANGNGKINAISPSNMMSILMQMGKTNSNGKTKTITTKKTPLTMTNTPIDDQSINEIGEPLTTELPSNISEEPILKNEPSADSGEGDSNNNDKDNNINNMVEDDDQHNIEDNEMPSEKAQPTTNLPSDNSITENPAAEDVTDTPIESGTTSEEDSDKDDSSITNQSAGPQQDVQIMEKDDGANSAIRSRARFLLYKPRFRSVQLARIKVNSKRARFLPILSSRNGVTRRLASLNLSNNRKRLKRLHVSSNKKHGSVSRKSSKKSLLKRGTRHNNSNQLRLKKNIRNHKKFSNLKKNSKRSNNRRKHKRSNSNSRRRSRSAKSRSQKTTNRRLIVLRNTPYNKYHN